MVGRDRPDETACVEGQQQAPVKEGDAGAGRTHGRCSGRSPNTHVCVGEGGVEPQHARFLPATLPDPSVQPGRCALLRAVPVSSTSIRCASRHNG